MTEYDPEIKQEWIDEINHLSCWTCYHTCQGHEDGSMTGNNRSMTPEMFFQLRDEYIELANSMLKEKGNSCLFGFLQQCFRDRITEAEIVLDDDVSPIKISNLRSDVEVFPKCHDFIDKLFQGCSCMGVGLSVKSVRKRSEYVSFDDRAAWWRTSIMSLREFDKKCLIVLTAKKC